MFLRSQKDTLSTFVNPKFISPGPTYYNDKSVFQPRSKIVTGSLSGPKQLSNDLGSFGTTQRFKTPSLLTPSPADYQNIEPKQHKQQSQCNALVPKKQKLIITSTAPSIPVSRNRIGQILEGVPPQSLPQQPLENPSQVKRSAPAYSFPKCEYPERQPIDDTEKIQEEIEVVEWTNKNQKRKGSLEGREQAEMKPLREENKRRKDELLDMVLNAGTIPSLEILQMRKKFIHAEVPGPGFYEFNINTLEVKDPKNAQVAFASHVERFAAKDEFPDQGPGKYRHTTKDKSGGFSFGRQRRQGMEAILANKQPLAYIFENLSKQPLIRPSRQPFGSGSVRFRSSTTSLQQPLLPPPVKTRSKSLRRIKKSITTSQTMESETTPNLQSIDVLFHMYGNS